MKSEYLLRMPRIRSNVRRSMIRQFGRNPYFYPIRASTFLRQQKVLHPQRGRKQQCQHPASKLRQYQRHQGNIFENSQQCSKALHS
jgi:hypothetical protein